MTTPDNPELFNDNTIVLDGGLGTTLEDVFGQDISHTPLWSSKLIDEDPNVIIDAHLAFLRAGAGMILTATYQSSYNTFDRAGYSRDKAQVLMLKAVELADMARQIFCQETGNDAMRVGIVLSLGPFGATLSPAQEFDGYYPPPYGPKDYSATEHNYNTFGSDEIRKRASVEALAEFHFEKLMIFASDSATWSKLDCIAFETVPLAREVEAIKLAMARLQRIRANDDSLAQKPWYISLVFPDGKFPELDRPGGRHLTPHDLVKVLEDEEGHGEGRIPDGIGINCTGMRWIAPIVQDFEQTLDAIRSNRAHQPWLVIYPNGGDVYDSKTQTWQEPHDSTGKRDMWATELLDILHGINRAMWGTVLLGGCCRTGPDEIRALALALARTQKPESQIIR